MPKPDVTMEGLINLLSSVETDLSNPDATPFIYRSDPPATSVSKDIIT